jgi:alpha-tubulin suppressor-like RCC1 family protein
MITTELGTGEVFSWGNNENGQCGTGREPFQAVVHWSPKVVRFDDYQRPFITSITCGSDHSAFIDGNINL